jgi:hypothetical protein
LNQSGSDSRAAGAPRTSTHRGHSATPRRHRTHARRFHAITGPVGAEGDGEVTSEVDGPGAGLVGAEGAAKVASGVDGPGAVVLELGEPALPDVAHPPTAMRNSNKTRNGRHGSPLRTGCDTVHGSWLDCPDIWTIAPSPSGRDAWATTSVLPRSSRGQGLFGPKRALSGTLRPLDGDWHDPLRSPETSAAYRRLAPRAPGAWR